MNDAPREILDLVDRQARAWERNDFSLGATDWLPDGELRDCTHAWDEFSHQLYAGRGNRLHRGSVVRRWPDSPRRAVGVRRQQRRLQARYICNWSWTDGRTSERGPSGPNQALLHLHPAGRRCQSL